MMPTDHGAFEGAVASLMLGPEALFVPPALCTQAAEEAPEFWKGLKRAADARFPSHGASVTFGKYDFFHDIIQRNRNNPAPAFIFLDAAGEKKALSYAELGELATARSVAWARQGVSPGNRLSIARVMGCEFVVDLLAGLRMGLVISVLPPEGREYLTTRLEAIAPDHLSGDPQLLSGLEEWEALFLCPSVTGRRTESRVFHGYETGTPVFRLISEVSSDAVEPVVLSSDAAYLGALRDGLLVLGLSVGTRMAAPEFPLLSSQPSMILAVLLAGATWVHLTGEDISRKRVDLERAHFGVFGVSTGIRERLLENLPDLSECWDRWFRSASEDLDFERWQTFSRLLGLSDSHAGNLRWDPALSGCTLMSVWRKGGHPRVLPIFGASLAESGEEDALFGQTPLMLPLPGGDTPLDAGCTVSKMGSEWIYTGEVARTRQGLAYPEGEILSLLEARFGRFGLRFSMVDLPLPTGGHRFTLLVFTCGRGGGRLEARIRDLLSTGMGPRFLPDRIRILPLFPRMTEDGEVDHAWCRDLYLTGLLEKRAEAPIFRTLTRMRARLDGMATPTGPRT